uniref:Uncharacterized protein n=2 Tax=Triticum urartu TaxID=4572 RepID=A0A8R7TPG8_TRIUA
MLRVLSKSLSTVARAGPATSDSLLSGHRAAAGEILPGPVPTHGLLTPRRGMATGRIEQMIAYGDVDLRDKGMMIAEDYYKLNKKKVIYHTPNKLVTGQKGALFPTVHDDTAFTFHSATGLVVQNHLNHVSVSK